MYIGPMDVTAVVNQKGGVGKSATTINVGAALAEMGRRVLIVDLDPQGHLTHALGLPDASPTANLAKALLGQWEGELGELLIPFNDRMQVLATSEDMFLLEPQLYSKTGREYLLSFVLDAYADAFDDCVIDCPPSLGALTDGALVASRSDGIRNGRILIPVQAEDSSLDALRLLMKQIDTVEEVLKIDVRVAGLVVNMYDKRRGNVTTSTLEALNRQEILVLGVIGDRKEIRESWRTHKPVIEHAPASEAAQWYRDLAKSLITEGAQ